MAMMTSTLYLPEETLDFRNYPELSSSLPSIQAIITYATQVSTALTKYIDNTFDRIDIDTNELQNTILLCRDVCSTLGNAYPACFDLLIELREFQDLMQSLMYVKNRYGSQYIGTPSDPTLSEVSV